MVLKSQIPVSDRMADNVVAGMLAVQHYGCTMVVLVVMVVMAVMVVMVVMSGMVWSGMGPVLIVTLLWGGVGRTRTGHGLARA